MTRDNVRNYLDCSTIHLSESTRDALDSGELYSTMRGDFGWLVFAGDAEDPPEGPEDLLAVLTHARILNCTHVLFDADAPMVEGLAVHDGT